jgi:hypothetical protein
MYSLVVSMRSLGFAFGMTGVLTAFDDMHDLEPCTALPSGRQRGVVGL